MARPPTDQPCPAFGTGCGGFLNEEGVCMTCGAVTRRPGDAALEPQRRYERWLSGD